MQEWKIWLYAGITHVSFDTRNGDNSKVESISREDPKGNPQRLHAKSHVASSNKKL